MITSVIKTAVRLLCLFWKVSPRSSRIFQNLFFFSTWHRRRNYMASGAENFLKFGWKKRGIKGFGRNVWSIFRKQGNSTEICFCPTDLCFANCRSSRLHCAQQAAGNSTAPHAVSLSWMATRVFLRICSVLCTTTPCICTCTVYVYVYRVEVGELK